MVLSNRWVLLLMVLFFVCPNLAAAADSDIERKEPSLADFLKIPAKGQVFSDLSYCSSSLSEKLTLSNVDILTSTAKESQLSETLRYGLSDRLSLGLNLTYALSSEDRVDYNSSSYTDYSKSAKGFYDPTFGVKGRMFGGSNDNMEGNFTLSVSPKVVDAKTATKDNEGTMGNGGTEVTAGLEFGTPLKTTQIAVGLEYKIRSDRSKKDADGKYESIYSGWNTLRAEVKGQVVLSPGITGALFYAFQDVDSYDVESKALTAGGQDSKTKYGKYTIQIYGIGGSFEINQNNLLYAIYQTATASNVDFDTSSGTTTLSGNIKDLNGTAVSIGWLSRF